MSTKKAAAPVNVAPHNFTHTGDEVLILRRIPKDRSAHSGFIYPKGVGTLVEAPDFNKRHECGGGLHGWPWGFGLGEGSDFDLLEDIWLILGADPADVVGELDKGFKCKCKKATIRFEGTLNGAIDMMREGFKACVQAMSAGAAGDGVETKDSAQLAASGYSAKLAASGDYAQLAASGYYAKLAASGYYAKLAASGDSAQLAASGDSAQLAASGKDSITALVTKVGKVKTGERGCFALAYWDEKTGWEFAVGKVGRAGIKADTWYHVINGEIVETSE